jgi:hypothetical protein
VDAHDLVALLHEKTSGDGRIHASTHGDDDLHARLPDRI